MFRSSFYPIDRSSPYPEVALTVVEYVNRRSHGRPPDRVDRNAPTGPTLCREGELNPLAASSGAAHARPLVQSMVSDDQHDTVDHRAR